jgi:hypothetical protein
MWVELGAILRGISIPDIQLPRGHLLLCWGTLQQQASATPGGRQQNRKNSVGIRGLAPVARASWEGGFLLLALAGQQHIQLILGVRGSMVPRRRH